MSSHTSVSASDEVPAFRHLLSKALRVFGKVLSNLSVFREMTWVLLVPDWVGFSPW